MEKLVYRGLLEFIAAHNLSEFLAAADVPDFRGAVPGAAPSPESAAPVSQTGSYPVRAGAETFTFISRPGITRRFQTLDFINQATWFGAQLNWIDVGTWATFASIIPERHLEAWKISSANQLRKKNIVLQEKESRVDELLIQIRNVPLITFRQARSANKSDAEIQRSLLVAYLGMLQTVCDNYKSTGQIAPPELASAVNYLKDYLKP
jgi:hypothetical protein